MLTRPEAGNHARRPCARPRTDRQQHPPQPQAWRGEPVAAVVENLLPDSLNLRRRVAKRVGAAGNDACSLLAAIGRNCLGALQFIADTADEPVMDKAIEHLRQPGSGWPARQDRPSALPHGSSADDR